MYVKNHNILVANISFENLAKITVFGNDTTKPNFMHEEIMNILNLGNASSQLAQDLFFSFAN
jgi:hypothetical protein